MVEKGLLKKPGVHHAKLRQRGSPILQWSRNPSDKRPAGNNFFYSFWQKTTPTTSRIMIVVLVLSVLRILSLILLSTGTNNFTITPAPQH